MNCRCGFVLANMQYKGFHEEERWLSKQAFTVFSCPRSYMTGLVYNLLPEPLGKVKQSWAGVSAVSSNSWVTIGKLICLHLHFLTCTNKDYNTHLKGLEGGLEIACWVTILMNKQESSLILFSTVHWRNRGLRGFLKFRVFFFFLKWKLLSNTPTDVCKNGHFWDNWKNLNTGWSVAEMKEFLLTV